MKKLLLIAFSLITILVNSQSINGNYKGWGFRGDLLGVNTWSLGSRDAFRFALITNGVNRIIFGVDGANTIWCDSTTFSIPLTINGGNTVNGANPYMQLKGYYIGAYRIRNSTTNYEWFMQNQTIAGGTLDNWSVGVSSNPDNGFIRLTKRGALTVQTYSSNLLGTRLSVDTIGRVTIGTSSTNAVSSGPSLTIYTKTVNTTGTLFTNGLDSLKISPITLSGGSSVFNGPWIHTSNNIHFHAGVGLPQLTIAKTQSGNNPVIINGNSTYTSSANLRVNGGGLSNLIETEGTANNLTWYLQRGSNTVNQANKGTATFGSTVITAGQPTLNVIGNASISVGAVIGTTLTVGNTNTLVGGNSGTIATLGDTYFQVTLVGTQSNPADATTYYFGQTPYIWNSFGAANNRYRLPVNCTLVNWTVANLNITSNGSNENTTFAVRKNDATDNNLTTTFQFTGSTDVSGTSTTDYAAGDLINIKVVTPTWATNPVGTLTSVTLWFKRIL